MHSDSESDVTIPEDTSVKDLDCLSDGSKRERAIQVSSLLDIDSLKFQ